MARPHPALFELAADRLLPAVHDVDIEALVASAFEHRMAGLLWSRVLAGELRVPPDTAALLGKQDLRSRRHALRLWKTLGDVQQRLAGIGVEVLVAKGVVTERRWYSRLGERPCNDLDLMLAPGAVERVCEVVELLQPGHPLRGSAQRLMSSGVLQSIDLNVEGLEVDLHADLLKFEIPTRQHDLLWTTAGTVTGPGGVTARVLTPELALVHLLLHLNKDNFARLSAYADVARILEGADLDWNLIDAFVDGEGIGVHVYSSLHDVVSALQLTAPPLPRPSGLRASIWRLLWPQQHRLKGRMSIVRHGHRQLAIGWTAEDRWREAAYWWFRRRILPPPELVSLYYPDTAGTYLWRLGSGRVKAIRRNAELRRSLRPAADRTATVAAEAPALERSQRSKEGIVGVPEARDWHERHNPASAKLKSLPSLVNGVMPLTGSGGPKAVKRAHVHPESDSEAGGHESSRDRRRGEHSYEIVIVHYRGAKLLSPLLAELPPSAKILVVDNSSVEDSAEAIAAQRPGTRYLDADGNIGFAAAANLGASRCLAPNVVFLNPDCRVSPRLLDDLVATLASAHDIGSCAPALVDARGAPQQSGGWQPTVKRSLVHALAAGGVFRHGGIFVQPVLGERFDVGWLSGACLAVRRDVFTAAGGFDEAYFMYQEDMSLGRRLGAMGYRQILLADLQAVHTGGGSSKVSAQWLWKQRGAALAAFLDRENALGAAVAMRLLLSAGFLIRGVHYRLFGDRTRVPEMRAYARALLLAEPAPPRP